GVGTANDRKAQAFQRQWRGIVAHACLTLRDRLAWPSRSEKLWLARKRSSSSRDVVRLSRAVSVSSTWPGWHITSASLSSEARRKAIAGSNWPLSCQR